MKKDKNTNQNLPVYYDTLKILSEAGINELSSNTAPHTFPRVPIERYNSKSFRVVNYHKHISRVFKDELFARKKI
ncbi:MAG: hypothetical protein EA362_00090 [Saprospirales bacterium]|jgi:hypothetical protein|nr:MAG: hypothetical protein EA362_00090 [Saprospirales bacterium]